MWFGAKSLGACVMRWVLEVTEVEVGVVWMRDTDTVTRHGHGHVHPLLPISLLESPKRPSHSAKHKTIVGTQKVSVAVDTGDTHLGGFGGGHCWLWL